MRLSVNTVFSRKSKNTWCIGIMSAAVLFFIGCNKTPTELPYEFDGEASGAGYIFFERLTNDKKAGITIHIQLAREIDGAIDVKYLRKLLQDGTLTVSLSDEFPDASVKVYEFDMEPFDSHRWYHGLYAYRIEPAWVAVSGEIILSLHPAKEGTHYPSASAELTDVVLSRSNSRQRQIIRSVEIPKVTVGYGRL
ncbi:MAG: hypothetical protein JJU05_03660 [Verrucomicrobia bacterium]|nr:hypothetical protein [Verrucomicrobiota bacterium]MCH8526498.1 hypothetical protein [Kiritimatiellia bacterium]